MSLLKIKIKLTQNYPYNFILFIVSLILFLIPTVFWFKELYYVGGDDTLLYYMYPKEMIQNYIFNIASNNVLSGIGSYSSQFYQLPFFLFILLIKTILPNINTQAILYGLNLSFGFLFFYLFLGIWIKNLSHYDFSIKILGGLIYIFSIFSYYTLWQSLLTPYLVCGFPLLIYLFLKAIKDQNLNLIILSSLVISLLSMLFILIPWIFLAILAIFPLLTYFFIKRKKIFILYSFIFICLSFLLNFYWLSHFLISYFYTLSNHTNTILDITSNNIINSAKDTVLAVTRTNNLIYPLFNLFHKNIQEVGSWPNYHIFYNWHEKFIYAYFLFTVFIVYAGTKLNKAKKDLKIFYLSSLIGWLIILYMFTVNVGNKIGVDIFIWLTIHIPGFTMFRNVMGKIAPAYPFIYALLITISFKIIFNEKIKKRYKKLIIIFSFLIVILNAKPFIFNEYFNNSLWTTKNTYTTISGFNSDFNNLVQYLNKVDGNSRYLWLPITAVNYVTIKDKNLENHYYTGLSPLQFLANKNDIVGIMSFPLETQEKFTKNFMNKNYDEIGNILKNLNVNYLIVNNDFSSELQKSYFFASGIQNLYSVQDSEFKNSILGNKIISLNNRYEIYKIKDKYLSNKITLLDDKSITDGNKAQIKFTKKTNYLYQININNLSGERSLIFLERYSPFWKLYVSNSNVFIPTIKHSQIYNYANIWKINSDEIIKTVDKNYYKLNPDGSINLNINLYFEPQKYFIPSIIVSLITILSIVCYFLLKLFLRFNKNLKA